MGRQDYLSLDGYTVVTTTKRAIGLRRGKMLSQRPLIWVPRSVVENGDEIDTGDTDICVETWFVESESLIT